MVIVQHSVAVVQQLVVAVAVDQGQSPVLRHFQSMRNYPD